MKTETTDHRKDQGLVMTGHSSVMDGRIEGRGETDGVEG